jgi:taurine dioxygenase
MRNTRFEVRPTSGALGAELLGIDLSQVLDADVVADIRQELNEHSVIFFRDQWLTPEQHVAFAERMGTININRFFNAVPSHPQIAEVRKEPAQTTNIGGSWHTDHSYDQVPALGSILLAREIPLRGGDTMFACMGQAYDAVSDGLKRTLKGLRAVHSSRHVFGAKAHLANPDRQDRLVNAELS